MGQHKWAEQAPGEDFFRILAPDGRLVGAVPDLDDDTLLRMYRTLVLTRAYETHTIRMQRRGELSVTAQSTYEEAVGLGAAAALRKGDWCFPSYRQFAAHLYWGVPMDRTLAILRGAAPETVAEHLPLEREPGVTFTPYGVILGTNVLNAAGSAMADRFNHRDIVTLAFTGEGSTSEGDFHDALNFAAVFKAPLVVVVHNNQWAISTPAHRQHAAPTFAHKALAHGLPGERVDGNDVLAMYQKTREAVDRARSGAGPTLIEAVTYRVVDHNTSDSAEVYRDQALAERWKQYDPRLRFEAYLAARGLYTDALREQYEDEFLAEVQAAAARALAIPRSDPMTMFENHLQGDPGWAIRLQQRELAAELNGQNPFTSIDPEALL
jgi:pyruvate dehydrogenase E1 component alpha subunit